MMQTFTIEYNGYTITTDKSLIPVASVHKWLSEESYWAKHIPYNIVKRSFDNSYTIGILKEGELVGYGRFITDYATFAYLADVFVTEPHRGIGLSKKMMELLMGLEWVQGLRSLLLGTLDAQGLYAQFGFINPKVPERIMQLLRQGIYEQPGNISS